LVESAEEAEGAETQRNKQKDGWVRDGRRHVFPWF
jgi:hypothetical protein